MTTQAASVVHPDRDWLRWVLVAVPLATAWVLVNWWVHDSLHIHFEGGTAGALLAIEYGFHFTLMIAGGILAVFFAKVVGKRA